VNGIKSKDSKSGDSNDAIGDRLNREEAQARIEKFKKEIEEEIRRRLVADRGRKAMAKTLRKPLPEDIDVMHASREEMVQLKHAVAPLARKLASRLAMRRRHKRKGPLDWRATMRASLAMGGVPAEPKFKHPRQAKPDIVILSDISGSVASFARFTLQLVYALSGQFSKVRSFVFIDGIDEVTSFFETSDDVMHALHRINTEADVMWLDGHSDYGHAFTEFLGRWPDAIGARTSVLILGDARNNYHATQSWVLEEIAQKAKHLYWLNPEPKAYWGSGDSVVGEYGSFCDGVHEVRTLRQLEKFVGSLD
ncbi:MAG: VWA domain-containing protein, partial [Acidimicrobiales bacterium]|nr:VWA domain-containing protein [Acidimicrobiales bacterium]